VGAQTAAYAKAYDSTMYGRTIRRRYCIQLNADGYRSHELTDPSDWPLFTAALSCWRFRNAA
jgi:hypothetical protein